ncbi:MAG: Ycf66 family protein, partial [Pseudanabaena sp.]
MINIGGNPLMILLAIVAALGGVGLYFVRNFRPELARDHDIFFSAIALVYGIILLAFNFRMEITTQLAQVLVVGFAGWFAVESLVLRQALANQARRAPSSPLVDDEEPIGSDYRVEIDPTREIAPRPTRDSARRMRGTIPS